MGKYLAEDQHLVPRTETPIRGLRSARGWRIVVSAFLRHSGPNQGLCGLRLRFIDPRGVLEGSDDILETIEEVDIGYLFGGHDDIFAVTSTEEHAYNVDTEIWLLPERGHPKLLLAFAGIYEKSNRAEPGHPAGVTAARETYDGVHAEAKGRVQEFWVWNSQTQSLSNRTSNK